MSFKTKLVSSLLSLTVVAGAMTGTIGQSEAKKLSKGEVAAIAGVGGFVLGLGIANANRGPDYYGYRRTLVAAPCRPLLRPLQQLRPSLRHLYRLRRFCPSLPALRGGDRPLSALSGEGCPGAPPCWRLAGHLFSRYAFRSNSGQTGGERHGRQAAGRRRARGNPVQEWHHHRRRHRGCVFARLSDALGSEPDPLAADATWWRWCRSSQASLCR